MTKFQLPSGQIIDFTGMDQETIGKSLKNLKEAQPKLFEKKEEKKELDYGSISFEDLQKSRGIGVDTSKEEAEKEKLVTNEGEVESHAFQFYYGKADDDNEREKRLTREFGENSFQRLGQNDYILNLDNISTEKKREYNLPEDGTIRVNKKGFSRYDLSRFTGEYRGPLLATTAVGLAIPGVNIGYGMLLMGAAGMAGKAYDELVSEQYIEDLQGQSKDDIYSDILIEGAMMAAGEGIFRGLFAAGRKIIKGPGPKPNEARVDELLEQGASLGEARKLATEEAKFEFREAIKKGARPNIAETTGKAFLGRLQAIQEAIIPNAKARAANRNYVKKVFDQFRAGKMSEQQLKETLEAQAEDITKIIKSQMKTPEEAFKSAKYRLDNVVGKELDEAIDIVKKGTPDETQANFIEGLYESAAKLWKADSNALYKLAQEEIGDKALVNASPALQDLLLNLTKDKFKNATDMSLSTKPLMAILRKQVGIDRVKNQDGTFKFVLNRDKAQPFTLQQINSLRTSLRSLSKDPNVAPGVLDKDIALVVDQLDAMMKGKEMEINFAVQQAKNAGDKIGQEAQLNGFNLLRNANQYYKDGADKFLTANVTNTRNQIREGFIADLNRATENFETQPELFKKFLKDITPDDVQVSFLSTTDADVFARLGSLAKAGDTKGFNKLAIEKGLFNPDPKFKGKQSVQIFSDIDHNLPKSNQYKKNLLEEQEELMNSYYQLRSSKANREDFVNNVKNVLGRRKLVDIVQLSKDGTETLDVNKFVNQYLKLKNSGTNKLFFDEATVKKLDAIANDADVLKKLDIEGIKNLNKLKLKSTNSMVDEITDAVQRATDDANDAMFMAIKNGRINNLEDITTGLMKNPEYYQPFVNRLRTLKPKADPVTGKTVDIAEDTVRKLDGYFDEATKQYNPGVKDYAMEKIIKAGFPEGITDELVKSGDFAGPMLKAIQNQNKNGALDTIVGKEQVKLLKEVLETTVKMSDANLKGTAGLAPAAFVAAAGYRALTAPLSFITEVGRIFLLGRALRSETVLKSMTTANLTSRQMRRAKELGVKIDDLQSIRSKEIDEFMRQNVRKYTTMGTVESVGAGGEAVGREIVTPATEAIQSELEESDVQIPTKNQIVNQASNALKQVEQDKLLGIS